MQGDFCTYLNLFAAYKQTDNREKFCKKNYLDPRVMAEIENIHYQLGEIVGDKMGIPIPESGGSINDYLCCIAAGMIQFVCIRTGRENYHSLTADHICIHPGSVMFRQNPVFIVAGEIVRTSRIFAMSVSPLTKNLLDKINPSLYERLSACKNAPQKESQTFEPKKKENKSKKGAKNSKFIPSAELSKEALENSVSIGDFLFETKKIKGKKTAVLPFDQFRLALMQEKDKGKLNNLQNLRGQIITKDRGLLMDGEKMGLIINAAKTIDLTPVSEKKWNRKMNVNINNQLEKESLIDSLDVLLRTAIAKQKNKEYGFICLYTDGNGNYWYKVTRGFTTALTEAHSSLEILIEEDVDFSDLEKSKINEALRKVNSLYEK
jgi:hypothetical protein